MKTSSLDVFRPDFSCLPSYSTCHDPVFEVFCSMHVDTTLLESSAGEPPPGGSHRAGLASFKKRRGERNYVNPSIPKEKKFGDEVFYEMGAHPGAYSRRKRMPPRRHDEMTIFIKIAPPPLQNCNVWPFFGE